MRELRNILIIAFMSCFIAASPCAGAFLDPGWGARPTGMGGAYTSASGDSDCMMWNPAGTAQARTYQATFMYAKPYMGLDLYAGSDKTDLGMNYGSALYPFRKQGAIGLGIANMTVSDLYGESMYILNLSLPVSRISKFFKKYKSKDDFGGFGSQKSYVPGAVKPVTYVGMNIKLLGHKYILDRYTESDPVFASGTSKSAISIDLGVLVLYKKLSCGLSLKDLNQPDVGLKELDKVPSEMRLGCGFKFRKFSPVMDISYRDSLLNVHLGGEYLSGPLGMRVGGNMDEVTAGMGIDVKVLQLDYSFIWPFAIADSYGTHRVSLMVKFGSVPEITEEELKAEEIRAERSKPEKIKIRKSKPKKIKIKKSKPEKIKIEKKPKPKKTKIRKPKPEKIKIKKQKPKKIKKIKKKKPKKIKTKYKENDFF